MRCLSPMQVHLPHNFIGNTLQCKDAKLKMFTKFHTVNRFPSRTSYLVLTAIASLITYHVDMKRFIHNKGLLNLFNQISDFSEANRSRLGKNKVCACR